MKLLDKCVGFKVMEFFLTHPSVEIHINELARRQEIRAASVKTYCDERAYHILLLKKLGIEDILVISATALHVKGRLHEKSRACTKSDRYMQYFDHIRGSTILLNFKKIQFSICFQFS